MLKKLDQVSEEPPSVSGYDTTDSKEEDVIELSEIPQRKKYVYKIYLLTDHQFHGNY